MSFWQFVRQDFLLIVKDKAIAMTVFGAIIFYSILYPLPYLHQVVTDIPIVVIDHDNSSLSRNIIRHADANPKIQVVEYVDSLDNAKKQIELGHAQGYLFVPKDFRKKVLLGQNVTLAYGGDANYFLVYSAIAEGLVSVGLDANKQLQFKGLMAKGTSYQAADAAINSLTINSVPVFNQSLGYLGYIIPAVFLLVLHQTLIIGAGILGAGQWRQQGYWTNVSPLVFVCGRITVFTLLYSVFSSFYFGWCFYLYGIEVKSNIIECLLLLLPFLLATAALGVAFSTFFNRRDLPTQVILLISMPILFVSGFVWPLELIPSPLIWISQFIPAIPAILASIKLNQMGADWSVIFLSWLQLWGLFIIFCGFAVYRVKAKLSLNQM